MQREAAYLLERRDGLAEPERRRAEVEQLLAVLRDWLASKKADDPQAEAGTFQSLSPGAKATFAWQRVAAAGARTWDCLRLVETEPSGTQVETEASVTDDGVAVSVFAAVSKGLTYSTVAPLVIDPRCPKFIREMLKLKGSWYHGPTLLFWSSDRSRMPGAASGRWVANEIQSKSRTIPIIVVSEEDGQTVLPDLGPALSHDLAALANIFVLDEEACWALTDSLDSRRSCYRGGVRLYWPRFFADDDPYRHPLWTATRLLSQEGDLTAVANRFRRQLRGVLFRASAVSVLPPRAIDEIRRAAEEEKREAIRQAAGVEQVDYRQLADLYAGENDLLRTENERLKDDVGLLQAKLASAQQRLSFQVAEEPDLRPSDIEEEAARLPPQTGDIRFYKKRGSTPNHDILIQIQDCGHNAWQPGHKADKARKGIERLENAELKTLWHCGSCQGGGVWKVKW